MRFLHIFTAYSLHLLSHPIRGLIWLELTGKHGTFKLSNFQSAGVTEPDVNMERKNAIPKMQAFWAKVFHPWENTGKNLSHTNHPSFPKAEPCQPCEIANFQLGKKVFLHPREHQEGRKIGYFGGCLYISLSLSH